MQSKVQIEELKERHVALVSFTGNYMGNPKVFKDLFDKLCGWAGQKGLLNKDVVFLSSYENDPNTTAPDELRLDLCMTASEDAPVEGEVQKKTLPGGKYAKANFVLKSPEEYGPAWEQVVAWAKDNDYELDMSRPSYEVYLNNPEEHPQKHHIIDVCLSVVEK